MKLRLNPSIEFFFVIIYKLALDFMYLKIQVPLFGYNGFVNDGGDFRLFIGWLIYLIL